MDEDAIREAARWLLISERVVEHELNDEYVWALIRAAYGKGYMAALTNPHADLEQAATATSALWCRLPV